MKLGNLIKTILILGLLLWPNLPVFSSIDAPTSDSYLFDTPNDIVANKTLKYKDNILKAMELEGIEPSIDEIAEILAQIAYESGGNPRAVGSMGEIGLMQLMPSTARLMGIRKPFDVDQNILGGIRYRQYLRNEHQLEGHRMLAGYNAGPANALKGYKALKYIRNVEKWATIFREVVKL